MEKKTKFKAKEYHKRLDVFLTSSITELSRSEISKIISNGKVLINDEIIVKKNHPVEKNDLIEIIIAEKQEFSIDYTPTVELVKLYEDDNMLIIDKPAGITVHPGSGIRKETILDIFMYYYPEIKNIPNSDRPGIVHRLDKDTTGILLLAKNQNTMALLQQDFKNRNIHKTYTAIIHGKPRFINGTIDLPIDRSKKNKTKFTVSEDEGARTAVTDYKLLNNYNKFSILELYPQTGRTHQLRVHMAHQKTPIVGDKTYGKRDNDAHMYLHASKINFTHPITGEELLIRCELPKHFQEKISNLKTNNWHAH